MKVTVENAEKVLQKYLKNNPKKLNHSLRVAKTSELLAKIWNVSVDDAVIVALLHDIGKSLTKKEMLSLCLKNGITVHDFDIWETPEGLHGKISEILFRKEFENIEPERFELIANAISYHVAGEDREQSILDKIIFIADSVEPEKNVELFQKIKNAELRDMNECIRIIIREKKEKAKIANRAYNPMLDAILENIDKENERIY